MKIVVKHFADPEETISAVPGKVTVEVEPEEGMALIGGGEPVVLVLGQQANVEIEGESQVGRLSIQAVLDTERLVAPGGLAVNPTYAKALGVGVPERSAGMAAMISAVMGVAEQRHPSLLRESEAFEAAIKDGLPALLADMQEVEVEPDGYQRHGEDAAERDDLGERNAAAIQRVGDAAEGSPMNVSEMAKLPQETIDNRIERAAVAMRDAASSESEHLEQFRQLARVAAGVFGFVADPITPEEARTLYAVWAGDAFDAKFLDSVQPKLEAIAGEDWR